MAEPAPSVTLELPSILQPVAGRRRFALRGRTVAEALEAAFAEAPALRHHLMQNAGALRPHILCIVNDSVLPREEAMAARLDEGDEILLHQAISGG